MIAGFVCRTPIHLFPADGMADLHDPLTREECYRQQKGWMRRLRKVRAL